MQDEKTNKVKESTAERISSSEVKSFAGVDDRMAPQIPSLEEQSKSSEQPKVGLEEGERSHPYIIPRAHSYSLGTTTAHIEGSGVEFSGGKLVLEVPHESAFTAPPRQRSCSPTPRLERAAARTASNPQPSIKSTPVGHHLGRTQHVDKGKNAGINRYKLISGRPDTLPQVYTMSGHLLASLNLDSSTSNTFELLTPINLSPFSSSSERELEKNGGRARRSLAHLHPDPSQTKRHHGLTPKHSYATREIAALDFLQSIPMRSEHQLLSQKVVSTSSVGGGQGALVEPSPAGNDDSDDESIEDTSVDDSMPKFNAAKYSTEDMQLGRRLPGKNAIYITTPELFRYRLLTRYPVQSAVVRRWESVIRQKGIHDSRMYFSRGKGYPVTTCSIIKYDGNNSRQIKAPANSLNVDEKFKYDWRGKSYGQLLHSTWTPCDSARDERDEHPPWVPYDPNFLDDPSFRLGRHRQVLVGDRNVGPIMSSTLAFVRPSELEEELNKQFRAHHSFLDSEITLSKIRNIKRVVLDTCRGLDLEISTAALACVYFEKLVLSQYINKANRKLSMAACFVLAFKFNEPMPSDALKVTLKKVLQQIDRVYAIPSSEVLTAEFKIYIRLGFALHSRLHEVQPHFARLLKSIESTPRKYMGDIMYDFYADLLFEEQLEDDSLELKGNEGAITRHNSSEKMPESNGTLDETCKNILKGPMETDLRSFQWSLVDWWKKKHEQTEP